MLALRLITTLFFPVLFGAGYLAFDYWNVNRMAKHGDGDGVTVSEYLVGWLSIADAIGGAGDEGPALPGELAGMMPMAPEGWTVRPTEPGDIDAFIAAGADEKAVATVRAVVNERTGNGLRQVRQTYQNGARLVVVELVRYPDFIFTSFGAMALKMELQMASAEFQGRDFMTVRGLEVYEDVLPEGIALRYFVGDVADQIWVRVLATKSMTDQDLLPFFETLHVPAMNANVVEKVPGLGDVPVIVLASVIDDTTRAALQAEREAEFARLEAERAAREAETAEAEKAKDQPTETAAADDGGSIFGGIAALFGADDSETKKKISTNERVDHQEALMEAARSGNGAAAALHAGFLYGAIAEELGKTEMKGASPSGPTASFALPGSAGGGLPGTGAGFKSAIEVGIGACGDRAGGKVCSVAGAAKN